MLTASLIPRAADLETAMVAVSTTTGQVVAVECHPQEHFWRRWWARIGQASPRGGDYACAHNPLRALAVAYGRHLKAPGEQGG